MSICLVAKDPSHVKFKWAARPYFFQSQRQRICLPTQIPCNHASSGSALDSIISFSSSFSFSSTHLIISSYQTFPWANLSWKPSYLFFFIANTLHKGSLYSKLLHILISIHFSILCQLAFTLSLSWFCFFQGYGRPHCQFRKMSPYCI